MFATDLRGSSRTIDCQEDEGGGQGKKLKAQRASVPACPALSYSRLISRGTKLIAMTMT